MRRTSTVLLAALPLAIMLGCQKGDPQTNMIASCGSARLLYYADRLLREADASARQHYDLERWARRHIDFGQQAGVTTDAAHPDLQQLWQTSLGLYLAVEERSTENLRLSEPAIRVVIDQGKRSWSSVSSRPGVDDCSRYDAAYESR